MTSPPDKGSSEMELHISSLIRRPGCRLHISGKKFGEDKVEISGYKTTALLESLSGT
jgi:hypothetical protein